MSDKTLRQLTRAYAIGDLDREQYRKARAELINGILAGEIAVPENDYPAPVRLRSPDDTFDEVTERKTRDTEDPAPAGQTPPSTESPQASPAAMKNRLLPAGIILAAALIYFLLPHGSQNEEPAPASTAPIESSGGDTSDATQQAPDSKARDLVRAFLKERSWGRESITEFVSSWQTLPVDERKTVRDSVEMSRLANAIYKQLLAEKALSNLDNGKQALEKQRLLVEFAREMRIDDPRIKMPESDRQPGTASDNPEPVQD